MNRTDQLETSPSIPRAVYIRYLSMMPSDSFSLDAPMRQIKEHAERDGERSSRCSRAWPIRLIARNPVGDQWHVRRCSTRRIQSVVHRQSVPPSAGRIGHGDTYTGMHKAMRLCFEPYQAMVWIAAVTSLKCKTQTIQPAAQRGGRIISGLIRICGAVSSSS
jgi:hypothetical protein